MIGQTRKRFTITDSGFLIRFRKLAGLLAWLLSSAAAAGQSIAFYYGKPVPVDLLANFEQVVVEPDNLPDIQTFIARNTKVFAYVSVGEINESRPWFKQIPKNWLLGKNASWGSDIVNLNLKEWQDFLIDKIFAPLWQRGYRGFFLDTLDSYELAVKNPHDRLTQQLALIKLIKAIHARFPGVELILNRGFSILPHVFDLVSAVAVESIFYGWDPAAKRFTEVSDADRHWLLQKLTQIQQRGLPIIIIDYVPPGEREKAREAADKIKDLGFTPWVSNPAMDMLGVGSIEVSPKRFLLVSDQPEAAEKFNYLEKLLAFLGYGVEYRNSMTELPPYCLAGKYTAILTRLTKEKSEKLTGWLDRQESDGLKVIRLGRF